MEQLKDKLRKVKVKGKDDNLEDRKKTEVVVDLSSCECLKKPIKIHTRTAGIDACMEELKDNVKRVKFKGKDDNLEKRKKKKVVVDLSSCEGLKTPAIIHNGSARIDACMGELKDKLKRAKVKGKDDNLEEWKKTKVIVNLSSCEGLKKSVIIHNMSAGIDAFMEELKDKVDRVKVQGNDENLEERKRPKVVVDLSSCDGLKKPDMIHNRSAGIIACMEELKDKLKRVKIKEKEDNLEERKKTKVVADKSSCAGLKNPVIIHNRSSGIDAGMEELNDKLKRVKVKGKDDNLEEKKKTKVVVDFSSCEGLENPL